MPVRGKKEQGAWADLPRLLTRSMFSSIFTVVMAVVSTGLLASRATTRM